VNNRSPKVDTHIPYKKQVRHAICAYRPWNYDAYAFKQNCDMQLFSDKDTLLADLEEFDPVWVFFLDWSWIVPKEILNKYKCVCFHEADLPNFRGGSPIQNQIIHGRTKTKLTAFLMDDGVDTGDILLQEDLSLEGHISDIMERVVKITPKMIDKILKGDYKRIKQGDGTVFSRRKPEESQLYTEDFSKTLEYLYNFIRMLEEPYPNSFYYVGERKFTFKSAEMKDGKIETLVEIE